ncbi:MAG: hypothetical protein O3C40_14215 [Planctomycetota bacterium]|nr:hypothetical protein [Planctomycetota bacterium]
MTTRILLSAFVMLAATSGCKTIDTDWMPKAPWNKKQKLVESQYDTPVRMAAIWSPDVLVRPGLPAARGFGGRLYFYNQANKPVKVEGQLVVYAYDDTAEEPQRESPDRKYAFTPEQFTSHHSESELGASYSVWLPWDAEVGGQRKSISVLPVFTSTSGKIVMGQQAINLLPGKKLEQQQDEAPATTLSQRAATGVRPAGFQDNTKSTASTADKPGVELSRQHSINTTTIELPRTMQQRVIEAAKNRSPTATPIGAADPALVEKARATLERLRANSSLPAEAGTPTLPSPSARFAPPRPRVPSSPTFRSASSYAPSRPLQPVQRFDPPSTQQSTEPMQAVGFAPAFERNQR